MLYLVTDPVVFKSIHVHFGLLFACLHFNSCPVYCLISYLVCYPVRWSIFGSFVWLSGHCPVDCLDICPGHIVQCIVRPCPVYCLVLFPAHCPITCPVHLVGQIIESIVGCDVRSLVRSTVRSFVRSLVRSLVRSMSVPGFGVLSDPLLYCPNPLSSVVQCLNSYWTSACGSSLYIELLCLMATSPCDH